jgi:hypothetical protein
MWYSFSRPSGGRGGDLAVRGKSIITRRPLPARRRPVLPRHYPIRGWGGRAIVMTSSFDPAAHMISRIADAGVVNPLATASAAMRPAR